MKTLDYLNMNYLNLEFLKTLAKIWLITIVNATLASKACMNAGLWMNVPQEKKRA